MVCKISSQRHVHVLLQKGITHLHEACEYALKLEKDIKRYSSEISHLFSLYNEKDTGDESKISELVKLQE